ncbi:hypothetical protein PM082_017855 [Marasmius tenuissimus]|nr:hypothetical protein PM082_017855 [Marasmius tenuissimus]
MLICIYHGPEREKKLSEPADKSNAIKPDGRRSCIADITKKEDPDKLVELNMPSGDENPHWGIPGKQQLRDLFQRQSLTFSVRRDLSLIYSKARSRAPRRFLKLVYTPTVSV